MTNSPTQFSSSLDIILLTQDQIKTLKIFQSEKNYPGAYKYLKNIVDATPSRNTESIENNQQLSTWLGVAAKINANKKGVRSHNPTF